MASILAGATPSTFEGLRAALAAASQRGGRFVPPLVVVEGRLDPELDPLTVLRAAIAVARAMPEGRLGALGELLDWASTWASAPEAASARGAARGVLARLADGFGAATRGLPAGYLEAEAKRAALEVGAFERRAMLGAICVRGRLELTAGEPEESAAVYLPTPGEDALPRFEALAVRVLGELRAPLEQDAAPPLSLRVIGIGRVLG